MSEKYNDIAEKLARELWLADNHFEHLHSHWSFEEWRFYASSYISQVRKVFAKIEPLIRENERRKNLDSQK